MGNGTPQTSSGAGSMKAGAAVAVLVVLSACTNSERLSGAPPETAATPPPAAASAPPPVELPGRWHLSAAAGGSCVMTFGAPGAGAAQGTIAPAGGCPGKFFTSRKWAYEHGALVIRDYKGQPLAQLSFADNHFEGQDNAGGPISLTR